MSAWTRLAPAGVALALLAGGCGSASQSLSSSSGEVGPGLAAPSPAPAGAVPVGGTTSAGLSATLSAVADPVGRVIVVSAAVSGPARLYGGCQPTLQVSLVDSGGALVPVAASPGSARCLAITDVPIAAGQTETFTATLPLPAAHGRYTVRASLAGGGELAPVSLGL